jgi:hypothetical protein
VRYEDRWNEWDTKDKKIEELTKEEATPPKSGTRTTQVWKEKTTLTLSPQEELASESPSWGSDDAPEKQVLSPT